MYFVIDITSRDAVPAGFPVTKRIRLSYEYDTISTSCVVKWLVAKT